MNNNPTIKNEPVIVEVTKEFFERAKILGSPEFKRLLMVLREYPDCKIRVEK